MNETCVHGTELPGSVIACNCDTYYMEWWPPIPPAYDNCSNDVKTFLLTSNAIFLFFSVCLFVGSTWQLARIHISEKARSKQGKLKVFGKSCVLPMVCRFTI